MIAEKLLPRVDCVSGSNKEIGSITVNVRASKASVTVVTAVCSASISHGDTAATGRQKKKES